MAVDYRTVIYTGHPPYSKCKVLVLREYRREITSDITADNRAVIDLHQTTHQYTGSKILITLYRCIQHAEISHHRTLRNRTEQTHTIIKV